MSTKRNRLQVVHDILNSIQAKNGKIKPTHILYKANLSHKMMDIYLKELISKGLINEIKGKKGKTYSLTEKGFDYLNKYKMMSKFIESFGLSDNSSFL